MLVPCSDEQAGRLAAFNIGDAEIAALQRQRARVADRMPQLFARLDDTSAAGRQASEGLWDEELKQLRNDYWHCIASGQLGDLFVEAATTFAKTAYANGVSGRAFTIRHSSGAQMLIDGLFEKAGAAPGASWATWVIRRQSIAKQRAQYANALQKALWMGLSILLEAYVQVEADQKRRAFQMIERSFSNQIVSVADVLGTQVIALEGAVFSITASAEQSTASVDLLADDAMRASAAVRDVSAATETLARSVNETGERIAQCAQSASDAAEQARVGDWAVAKFADSTAAIDQVTMLIRGIADRTKLLALNASIEAVRAGDYGRGFAVVASEVSSLAKETATAINRVGQQVSLIRASAQESSAAIHALAGKIEEVSIIASVIASSVLEQVPRPTRSPRL